MKFSNEQIHLCGANIYLKEVTIFIHFQTNNKSSGNDGQKAELYKKVSRKSFPIILDVYGSRKKLGTMGVSPRAGVISIRYKKNDNGDISNYRPISLLHLDYKVYTRVFKNCTQEFLNAIISEQKK